MPKRVALNLVKTVYISGSPGCRLFLGSSTVPPLPVRTLRVSKNRTVLSNVNVSCIPKLRNFYYFQMKKNFAT